MWLCKVTESSAQSQLPNEQISTRDTPNKSLYTISEPYLLTKTSQPPRQFLSKLATMMHHIDGMMIKMLIQSDDTFIIYGAMI